jgi:hypothetical protein
MVDQCDPRITRIITKALFCHARAFLSGIQSADSHVTLAEQLDSRQKRVGMTLPHISVHSREFVDQF